MKKSISWTKIVEYLVSLFYILEINTVFFKSLDYNFYISELGCFFTLILFFITPGKLSKKQMCICLMYYLYIIVFTVFSNREAMSSSYIIKFYILIPALYLLYSKNFNEGITIIKCISSIMVFLAITSLIMFCLSFVIPPLGQFNIYWGHESSIGNYLFFYTTQLQDIAGQHYLRNTGIFCEAPMYGFNLVMALSTQLFFYDKINKRNLIALSITIVSTLSVTAVALMLALYLLKYYVSDNYNRQHSTKMLPSDRNGAGKQKMLFTFCGIAIVSFAFYYLYNFKVNTGASYSKRLDDYIAAFNAWKTNPFWGIGYGKGDLINQYMASWRIRYNTTGFTSAIMIILTTMGIFGSVIYVVGFFKGIKYNYKRNRFLSFQYIVLLLLLFVTVVPAQIYVLSYVALGMASQKEIINGRN